MKENTKDDFIPSEEANLENAMNNDISSPKVLENIISPEEEDKTKFSNININDNQPSLSVSEEKIINNTNEEKDKKKEIIDNEIIPNINNIDDNSNSNLNIDNKFFQEKPELIINNNEDKNNINNINNININTNLNNFSFINNFNFNNLSQEEKSEQIQNNLHLLLIEISSIKEKGNQLFGSQNYEEAEKVYREGLEKINAFNQIPYPDSLNEQIQIKLLEITNLNKQLCNNLSATLIKLKKYDEAMKISELIIQNFDNEHVASYGRILFSLIEMKKVIYANHYAEIIKKKYNNTEHMNKFKDSFTKLEKLNKELSNKILNQNPLLKNDIINMNNNILKKKEEEEEKNKSKMKALPYFIGGAAFLGIAFLGRMLINKYKKK